MTSELKHRQKKNAIVIPGRFNPPHAGHAKLVEKARMSMIGSDYDAIIIVVIAGKKTSEDKQKNPLTAEERVDYLHKSNFTKGVDVIVAENAFDALAKVRNHGYEPIEVIGGFTDDGKENRAEMYKNLLDKYFDDDGTDIKHVATGVERDPLAGNDKAISGTMVRLAATTDNYDNFDNWTSLNTDRLTRQMYIHVKNAMEQ